MQNEPNTGGDSKCADDLFPPRRSAIVATTHIGAPRGSVVPFDSNNILYVSPPEAETLRNWVAGLTTDATDRKQCPITSGVLDYFPDAIAEVARLSKRGNDQHNPGQPMHWDRSKSSDHADCIVRHLIQRGTRDTDGMLHSAKVAWRALAMLQLEIESLRKEMK